MSTDQRSGVTNDPNRPDAPELITRLLDQVITVSLETVKVINSLTPLENRRCGWQVRICQSQWVDEMRLAPKR